MKQTNLLFLNMIPEQSDITERVAYEGGRGAATDAGRDSGKQRKRFWLWLILVLYLLITLAYGAIACSLK